MRRCLFCGLLEGECTLSPSFGHVLCIRCAPRDARPLEAALRAFAPWAQGAPELPPCAACGASAAERPTRGSSHTGVELCVPCLLAGIRGEPFETSAVAAALQHHRAGLDAARTRALWLGELSAGPFDPAKYDALVEAERAVQYTSLTFAGALFELARACKLRHEPPIPLTPEEVAAGLRASFNVCSGDPVALAGELRVLVPHVRVCAREDRVLGLLVAAAVTAHDMLAPDTREELSAQIERLSGGDLRALPADADLEVDARNPYISEDDARCAAHAIALLRGALPISRP